MMTNMMMVVVIAMMIIMRTNFLSAMMVIKIERLKTPQQRKNSCPLLGIPQDNGIGVMLDDEKKETKNMGINMDFFVFDDQIQQFSELKRTKKIKISLSVKMSLSVSC